MAQFLTESVCLSTGSVLLGVALSRLAINALSRLLNSPPPEDLFVLGVGLGVVFAVVLGVGAGAYPSLRASRMEVITAVRYE